MSTAGGFVSTLLALVTFALIHLAAVMSPGPSFVVVLKETLAGRTANGVWCAFGMALATLVWALAAWFGLSALFIAAPWLYLILKLAGAGYLIYLAIQLWRHSSDPPMTEVGPDGDETPKAGALAAIRRGVLTQLANPKVAVFFGSIFLAVLPQDPSATVLAAAFAIVFLNEFVWYAVVALAMGSGVVRRRYGRIKPLVDRVTGAVLGVLGVRLAAG